MKLSFAANAWERPYANIVVQNLRNIEAILFYEYMIYFRSRMIFKAKQKPKNGSMCKICYRQIKDFKYDFCSEGYKVKSHENSIKLYEEKCSSKRSLYLDSNGDVPLRETNEVEIIESSTSGEDKIFNRKRS
ncbi:unnamed protein product [Fraxinus pennsylvanica]|uniref:Uncharacterized protein n=1 Tax=Fraxinus pennsylvanica TaxID=56036 RepID=A0AAD2DW09_9LAMI|nr:unnamed protein product [Fraxinus pennsylvanica]